MMRNIKKQITVTTRPYLPHEHPGINDRVKLFGENLRHIFLQRRGFHHHKPELAELFLQPTITFEEKFCHMAGYFIDAFRFYARFHYSRVYLPGLPSEQGCESDAIEATARSLPLLAVWLHYRRQSKGGFNDDDEQLRQILMQALIQGTEKNSQGYWGVIRDYDQRICECCDIALTIWLSREVVWRDFTSAQRQQILAWLSQINHCQTVDNNWHLFIVLTQLIIRSLSGYGEIDMQRYHRIKAFYVGDGWFRDGAKGNYDYYNSWGFHYLLFWIDQIDTEFDRNFIRQSCHEFCQNFRYFFTPCGFPFFGRSACYRLAAPCALMAQAIQSGNATGQLKRIIATLHDFFIRRGAVTNGVCTQGLFQANRALLDGYSGTGSSLWGLRTLILMLYGGKDCGLWQVEETPLEIEKSSFDLTIEAISARISGVFETQEIIVSFMENKYFDVDFQQARLIHQGVGKRMVERLSGRSTRPKNNLLRKGITTYSSKLNIYL